MKKNSKILLILVIVISLVTMLCSCGNTNSNVSDRETINQISLLQGLLDGDYYGSISIENIKKLGDIGIGTFDKLNGELIMIDGIVYRAKANCEIEVPKNDETIPFSNVTFFDNDFEEKVSNVSTFNDLVAILNKEVKKEGTNNFYFARIDASFNKIKVRSEYAQSEPYKPLVKVLETDQVVKEFDNIEGTIVALYCPTYMKELNNYGWHMHFVSKDKTKGGHVFETDINSATIKYDITKNFAMKLPSNEKFESIDFSVDRQEEVESAETNK